MSLASEVMFAPLTVLRRRHLFTQDRVHGLSVGGENSVASKPGLAAKLALVVVEVGCRHSHQQQHSEWDTPVGTQESFAPARAPDGVRRNFADGIQRFRHIDLLRNRHPLPVRSGQYPLCIIKSGERQRTLVATWERGQAWGTEDDRDWARQEA